ncbi:MAG TPA: caspase family protein [Rhizobiaceae bacterium]|nr:caspase family protein [Rhizobiaceae bacterium]
MIKLTRRSVLLGATALTAAGMAPFATLRAQEPRTYFALLVAVTAYPNLPPKASLIGPNHDAVLVRDYLLGNAPVKFLPENVTVLADNLEGAAGSPTHEAILAALAGIASKAERNDFVYLHMSGHGANQPQVTEGDETDGLDEIFLPADTGKWEDRTKGVPNALMDNQIGQALDAIRAKGAFVWIIFDCCHSGTATRAAPMDEALEQERKVPSDWLGIPDTEMAAAAAGAAASRGVGEDENTRAAAFSVADAPTTAEGITKGDIVAFYAAQTVETTPEMPLPKGDPNAERFGLFTYTIFSKLAENPNVTYRQLGHAVLQQYAADARVRPTPLFEGTLDARVFGSEKLDTIMQWQIEVKDSKATIAAGLLHRLSPGTKLAILPGPTSELSEALGYVEIASAKNLQSTITPVEFEGKPALKLADIPPQAYARLAELVFDYKLVVARPPASDDLKTEVAAVNQLLDDIAAAKDKPFNVQFVDAGQQADIRLAVLRENAVAGASADAGDTPALWFLPASGDVSLQDGSKPPLVSMADPQKLKDGTTDNLAKIYRATSLSRLASGSFRETGKSQLKIGPKDAQEVEVSLEFRIKRHDSDTMEPLQEAVVPRVNPGDEVHIFAKNLTKKIFDINILYVGSDYSITHIDAQRLVADAGVEEGLLAFTDSSFGMERMIAVFTEAPPLSEIEDLSFLAQGGVPAATRGTGPAGFADMLRDIGMAPETRSAMKLSDKGAAPKGAVMIFPMETVPLTN